MADMTINGVRISTELSDRRVATLDVKNAICFSKTYEAINAVIGTEYAGWMKAAWNNSVEERPFYIWFPKLAEKRDGKLVPAANDYINTISDDWNEFTYEDIQHRNSDRERTESTLILIFAKDTDGGGYIFRGVFVFNPEKSGPDYHVYKRISQYAQVTTEKDVSGSLISVINIADSAYVDYSEGKIQISKEQWIDILHHGVLKEEYLDTLYKFYLAPGHTSTCLEMGAREQASPSAYITPVVQMSKAVAEYLGLPPLQRPDGHGRWWPVLFLGRRLLDDHFEWRVRPELVQALEETSADQIGNCRYRLEEKQSRLLDSDELFAKAMEASAHKKRVYYTEVRHIQRDPYIAEWAKRRENGVCLLCGKEGPFKEDNGRPFLETHHIKPLSEGGADHIYNVAALCPNCHRKMHHTRNENYEKDLQFLKNRIENYRKREQGT